jgi:BirA family biotin operon repressor/biotin-[acetyl-CoA-carboxylase] ligase
MSGTRFADIRRFGALDSTNQYLLGEARSGADEGVVAVAEFQTAGRGRLGRRWEAPEGSNLLMSVLLRPPLPADRRYLAGVVMALAAGDAAERVAGALLAVNWPNDLLGPDGRKVAGVLAESDLSGPGGAVGSSPAVVVGIGINVNWPVDDEDVPPDLVGTAGSLRRLVSRSIDRVELLDALLEALEPRVEALGTAAGRASQAETWRSRCATVGTAVRVELVGETVVGTAVDLTPEGHLVVETEGVARELLAGDVVHLRPRTGTAPAPGPR